MTQNFIENVLVSAVALIYTLHRTTNKNMPNKWVKDTPNQMENLSGIDCNEDCKPINMVPFYIKGKDGICFLASNQCVLQSMVCNIPEMEFDVDMDGSCGGVPIENFNDD